MRRSGRKRKRMSNETALSTPVQSTIGPLSTSSPIVPPSSLQPPPSTIFAAAEPASTSTDQKTTSPNIGHIPSPAPSSVPTFHPPPLPPAPSAAKQKVMSALNSACPNCNQNLGKPWHLVDHMIQLHDAQLLRLHRTLKKPDGANGMTVTSQMFTDRQCPYCQLTYADMQIALLHVVRTHRSRLFECPDNGECVLTCELMCAIGAEQAPKKFTISVKVKRKTTGE